MEDAIAALRRFNRFFTQFVGALDAHFLGTQMSLAEARLLFEIAHRDAPVAADLQAALEMDGGYLSRVLARFERQGLIARDRSAADGRRRPIRLTRSGREAFDVLDTRQREEVRAILARLDAQGRARLSANLATAQALLEGRRSADFSIRTFRPGDMGLIVSRQTILYHGAYGWNSGIEANEAEVVAAFLKDFKPGREQCWIAEVDGQMAGSIFLTDEGAGLSRLRLLYVEPSAQGLGVGTALVRTCLAFAREVRYRRMTLWTHSILESARRVYAREGFRIVSTQDHDTFGPMLTGETWELDLAPQALGIAPMTDAQKHDFAAIWVPWLEGMGRTAEPEDLAIMADPATYYRSTGGEAFLALLGGRVVGGVAVKGLGASGFEFGKLVVSEAARGSGAGRALVQTCLDFAAAKGGPALYLQSFKALDVALKLYERMGFQPAEAPPEMTVLARTEVIMGKAV